MSTETMEQYRERARRQAMRTHLFEPMGRDARYCGHMSAPARSGSVQTGYVSVSAECGYPADLHPPRPPAIGSGINEQAFTVVANKRHRCQEDRCSHVIQVGETYVRAVLFPGHGSGYADVDRRPVHWTFCVACATRYGRELPPPSNRSQSVDQEAVDMVVTGRRAAKLRIPERRLAVTLMSQEGLSVPEMARRTGLATRSIQRIRARLGLSGGAR
jgi:hypothetical protein